LRNDAQPGMPGFGKLMRCPDCSEEGRRVWLARNCGLEGPLMDAYMDGWKGGDWPDLDEEERERRIQQRRLAWKAIRGAIDARAGLYTFHGDFGSGKTHALATVCNELRTTLMMETLYVVLAGVLDHLRSLYAKNWDTSSYWQRLLDVPVLALDEVTRFNETKWANEKVFLLANTRYERRTTHLTLFATNDDPRQALPTGDALGYLYSRMREGGVVELRGDMRTGKGK
jgi:DNA replication protein DnaC